MPYLINDDLPGHRPFVPEGTDVVGIRGGWREDDDQSDPPVAEPEPDLSATEPLTETSAAPPSDSPDAPPLDQPTEDPAEQPARRPKKEQQ